MHIFTLKELTRFSSTLEATIQGREGGTVDGEAELSGQTSTAGAHDVLAEVLAGADHLVLELAALGHGLGPATVRLKQFAKELLG